LMMTLLVLLSQLKYHVLMMTASFVDLMIVDTDTVSFLFMIFPVLRWIVALSLVALVPLFVMAWRLDPLRVRRRVATALLILCLGGLTMLEMQLPMQPFEAFYGGNLVSSFARSGVDAVAELMTHGLMQSAVFTADRLNPIENTCAPAAKPPHIILIHDESARHSHRARHQSAERLRRAFQVIRRQGAQLPGRGQWRSELVRRIQRAGGIIGPQLRPVCLFRHQDRGRPRQSRPADRFAALRLSHRVALSSAWRVHERTQLPGHHRRAGVSTTSTISVPVSSNRTVSSSMPRRG